MLSMTAQTSKRGADIYFHEQAHMLAKSATEYALLAISGHNNSADCITNINSEYGDVYDINTTIRYIGLSTVDGTCANGNSLVDTIVTPESNGTVMIDVYITLNANSTGAEALRFHRRTLQKP